MKKLIVVLLLAICSCAYGQEIKKTRSERRIERALKTKQDYKVRDAEFKKWSRGKMRPDEILQISLFVFVAASVTDYVYKNDLIKRK